MREGWEYKTFGEVGSFLRGKSIQKADFVENGMPCIHYGQIHTKFGVSVDKHLSEIPLGLYNKSIIASHGDVIIAITSEDLEGSCKSTAWLGNYDIAVSSHAAVYKHTLNPKFIAYYLRSKSFYYEKQKYARGFKVMEIKPTDIEKIPIPVPPLSEQQRIVSELDLLSSIIEKKKAQLKEYDQLAQSIFYDMFGDLLEAIPTTTLKEVASYYIGLTYKPTDVSEKGTIVLRSSNIQNNILDFADTVRVNLNVGDNKIVKDGDILMCARNGSARLVGKVARIKNIGEKMSFGAFMTIIRSNYNDYLFHFFLSDFFRNQLSTSKTATINQITSKMLDNIKLNVPPLPLQQSFASKIEAIERQKALIQQSITEAETLFNSRMDYWFS